MSVATLPVPHSSLAPTAGLLVLMGIPTALLGLHPGIRGAGEAPTSQPW